MNGLAGESLKAKIQEFESFFSELLACMPTSKKQPLR
ncbi:hypothetical protein N406_07735 [Helicobacter pylori FD577]|nr:hypothetical protein N406_07735 [Helicobacter pylori FD577]